MEPSGTKWNQVEPNGTKWNQVGPSGTKLNQVEPGGTKLGTNGSLYRSFAEAILLGAVCCKNLSLPQLEPSGTKQEPSQNAINNISCALWNQVKPTGTKLGTKPNLYRTYAKTKILVATPSPIYNTK